jgi:hypothetical protein
MWVSIEVDDSAATLASAFEALARQKEKERGQGVRLTTDRSSNFSSALEEDEQEQVAAQLLVRSPLVIVCPKNRRSPKRALPKLKDFRHDKFLSLDPAYGFGYEEWLRGVCKQLGGF